MLIYDGQVITNDQFLRPSYRISPFKTKDIARNIEINSESTLVDTFGDFFSNRKFILTRSGREAINKALLLLRLEKEDIVTIFTTTNNFYISGCVTKEIEKHCKWSRSIEKNTKVIFVNHEFGFPYEDLEELKKYNYPIIEDCAHSFLSNNLAKNVGFIGDYVIYSLPKIFPIQFGGILLSNTNSIYRQDISDEEEEYILKVIQNYIKELQSIKSKRITNYRYLEEKLHILGLKPRFQLKEYHCPGVYMFEAKNINLNKMKIFLQEHGVECSVFYGEDTFFIPVNQGLEIHDLDYICALIKYYISMEGSVKIG